MNLGHLKAGHVRASKGFTLIELLVVIAIIGILSSVVLASLNTARNRGNDAKIESQLKNMQSAMALYQTGAGNYGTTAATDGCTASPSVAPWNDAASGMLQLSNENNYPTGASLLCYTSGAAWAAQAVVSDGFFCVDSSGLATSTPTTKLGGTAPDTSCL